MDFTDDALYFRRQYASTRSPIPDTDIGGLWRYRPGVGASALVASLGEAVSTAPSIDTDPSGRHWVRFGTGRLFVEADKPITTQQSLYGIKEPSRFSHQSS